jgi:CheY-like chemotaxis protein
MNRCASGSTTEVGVNSVLVVDDEVLIRQILVRQLRALRLPTTEAPDATTALDLVTAGDPDVVLVDIQMPGNRDGLWLVGRLRQRFPKTAIVLATGTDTIPPAVSMQDGVVESSASRSVSACSRPFSVPRNGGRPRCRVARIEGQLPTALVRVRESIPQPV